MMSYLSHNHFSLLILFYLFCLISHIRQIWLIDYFFLLPFPSRYLFLLLSQYRLESFMICFVLFLWMFFLVYLNVNLLFCKLCFIMLENKSIFSCKLTLDLIVYLSILSTLLLSLLAVPCLILNLAHIAFAISVSLLEEMVL